MFHVNIGLFFKAESQEKFHGKTGHFFVQFKQGTTRLKVRSVVKFAQQQPECNILIHTTDIL